MYAEWEIEKQNLTQTRVIVEAWLVALKMNYHLVDVLESFIVDEAKREWGNETLVDFRRDWKMVAVEHPENGVVGLGNYPRGDTPVKIASDADGFYYDWSNL
jgi:hypothetical protein